MKNPILSSLQSNIQQVVLILYGIVILLTCFGGVLCGLNWGFPQYADIDRNSLALLLASVSALFCLYYFMLFMGQHYCNGNWSARSEVVNRMRYWPPLILLLEGAILLVFIFPIVSMGLSAAMLLLVLLGLLCRRRSYSTEIVRGTKLITIEQAYDVVQDLTLPHERMVMWAGMPFPERYSSQHYAMIGSIGEGKSVSQKILLSSLLPYMTPGSDWRGIVFDIKREMYQFLHEHAQCPVHMFNPFDKRSCTWHLAVDFNDPVSCHQLGVALIEDEKEGNNSFFTKSARGILAAVLVAYTICKPKEWTLAEVLYTVSDRKAIETTLRSVPQTKHYAKKIASYEEKTLSNVLQTIHANAETLGPIANLMARSEKRLSLREWLGQESILVLSLDESMRTSLLSLYRALFQRLSQLILSLTESSTRRIFLFNDELAAWGPWEALSRLMWTARSKGFRAVLSWQTMEGLRSVYKNGADDIAGLCANKLLLRSDSPETCKYYSQVIGEAELRQWTRSEAKSGSSMTEAYVKKEVVLPSEFMHMPRANQERFFGFYVNPDVGCFHGPVYFSHLLPKNSQDPVPDFVPRPTKDQYLPEDLIIQDLEATQLPSLDDFSRIEIGDNTDDDIMTLLEESEQE